MKRFIVFVLLIGCLSSTGLAAIVWEGKAVKDAMVRMNPNSGDNHGVNVLSFGGTSDGTERYNGLAQWDLPAELNAANILSATVIYDLHPGYDDIGEVGVVRGMTQSWLEGSGWGMDDATAQGCSWETYDGTNEWADWGGDDDGVEYDKQTITTVTGTFEFDVTDLVQKWADGTLANSGIKLTGHTDTDGNYFAVTNREYEPDDANIGAARLNIVFEPTLCAGNFLDGDLDEDCYVDVNDLKEFALKWLSEIDTTRSDPEKNQLIYAPQISAITVDGNLSEWSDASDWADFGPWWHLGAVPGVPDGNNGLASTTRAKYAWNDAANMFYIGIESNEPDLILEIGGLMGDAYDGGGVPYSDTPSSGTGRTTQIEFKNWSGGIALSKFNQSGGVTTGVTEAYTINAGVMTIEIETPIFSNWYSDLTVMDLVNRMDIYEYADVFDTTGIGGGDSQIADGTYVQTSTSPTTTYGSLIRLIQSSSPQSCDDVPEIFPTELSDYDADCIVDWSDFAHFALDWMNDSVP